MPRPALPPVVLEITPPAEPRPGVLLRRAGLLGPDQAVVNVISRRDRWSSLDASTVLLGHGYDPVWHLANRGRTRAAIEREISQAARAGVRRVLCIRGEYASAPAVDEPRIHEVVALVRARLPAAAIGVTVNQHGTSAGVLPNLLRKLDAGADFVQTQVGFDLRGLERISRAIATRHAQVDLVPMLLPVLSAQAAARVARRLRIPLDQGLHHALERRGPEAGWEAFAERLALAHVNPAFASVALMTAIDPAPPVAERLRAIVCHTLAPSRLAAAAGRASQ